MLLVGLYWIKKSAFVRLRSLLKTSISFVSGILKIEFNFFGKVEQTGKNSFQTSYIFKLKFFYNLK